MPETKFKNFWNAIIMILLVYTGTYVPYKTAFVDDTSNSVYIFELCVDALFITDVLVNFISAYEDREKNIEFRLHFIALNYIRSWLLIDVVSCIPFQLID
jgi:hypothetical protein